MVARSVEVVNGGKLVIPAEFRRELGIEVGDMVIVDMVDGELRICTPSQAIKRAQAIVREFVPADLSLADQLITDRRTEAGRE